MGSGLRCELVSFSAEAACKWRSAAQCCCGVASELLLYQGFERSLSRVHHIFSGCAHSLVILPRQPHPVQTRSRARAAGLPGQARALQDTQVGSEEQQSNPLLPLSPDHGP